MSLEENKAILHRLVEATNKRDLTVPDEFIAPDYVDHTNQVRGLEGYKNMQILTGVLFPVFHRTIEDIIAEGDKVWVHFRNTGTTSTGKNFESDCVHIFRILNGKVVESWIVPQVSKEK